MWPPAEELPSDLLPDVFFPEHGRQSLFQLQQYVNNTLRGRGLSSGGGVW